MQKMLLHDCLPPVDCLPKIIVELICCLSNSKGQFINTLPTLHSLYLTATEPHVRHTVGLDAHNFINFNEEISQECFESLRPFIRGHYKPEGPAVNFGTEEQLVYNISVVVLALVTRSFVHFQRSNSKLYSYTDTTLELIKTQKESYKDHLKKFKAAFKNLPGLLSFLEKTLVE